MFKVSFINNEKYRRQIVVVSEELNTRFYWKRINLGVVTVTQAASHDPLVDYFSITAHSEVFFPYLIQFSILYNSMQ